MRRLLLLLSLITTLAVGVPAYSQYIYMDLDGDGVNSFECLSSSTTGVDVYLDTGHNANGGVASCHDGTNPLDIALYDIIIHKDGNGSVTFDGWTNAMAGFTLLNVFTVAGTSVSVGYTSADYLPPGLYKLGRLALTVTGSPYLVFVGTSTDPQLPSPATAFGSHCSGSDNPNYITLGLDFVDNAGTCLRTPVEASTWGKIKQIYR
jgi:hypothetical protein